ncbi:MAG: YafY family transcriptional regulator [Gammaproteobacteria bacterium]|nr:YafY family transcriptional regulator [Gammaproteobacteria bacterium]MDH3857542.1 YafY family transcriptional regulator [Gammaproteobacteria bacterium]
MDRTERFHLIDQMLCNQRVVTRSQFLDALEVSPATFKRDLEYLRDRLAAPIVWDRERRGYCYEQGDGDAQFQLPGLWFNTSEIQALLTMDALLENLQPGVLSNHIEPLRSRIRMLLDDGDHSVDEISHRIRIIPLAAKAYRSENFQVLCQALLSRKCVDMTYYSRPADSSSERRVSPQRLIYYRDNWYLDAWCHLRSGLRSFSIDAIQVLQITGEPSIEVDETELNRELESGYGIFSGARTREAVLRFSPQLARWVSRETWHPDQQSEFDGEGYYILRLPYSQDTELVMDILKHGAEVEVLAPPELKARVKQRIVAMQALYAEA